MDIILSLVILGAILIIAELFIGIDAGLDLLLIGSCLMVGGILGYFTGNTYLAVGVSGALSVTYILFGRSYIKSKSPAYENRSNVDILLGKEIEISFWDAKKKVGRAQVGEENWRISSEDKSLTVGSTVIVENVSGVTLIVKKK